MAEGLFRELNPGPLAPEARIMPLDQAAMWLTQTQLDQQSARLSRPVPSASGPRIEPWDHKAVLASKQRRLMCIVILMTTPEFRIMALSVMGCSGN